MSWRLADAVQERVDRQPVGRGLRVQVIGAGALVIGRADGPMPLT
jgi:hypothetical protein